MSDELTIDELREHAATALGGTSAYQRRRVLTVVDILIDRLAAALARVAELEAPLTGDIQAVTADGQQHRIKRGDWRPYPASLAADEDAPTP